MTTNTIHIWTLPNVAESLTSVTADFGDLTTHANDGSIALWHHRFFTEEDPWKPRSYHPILLIPSFEVTVGSKSPMPAGKWLPLLNGRSDEIHCLWRATLRLSGQEYTAYVLPAPWLVDQIAQRLYDDGGDFIRPRRLLNATVGRYYKHSEVRRTGLFLSWYNTSIALPAHNKEIKHEQGPIIRTGHNGHRGDCASDRCGRDCAVCDVHVHPQEG